jgi:hypothetical protein
LSFKLLVLTDEERWLEIKMFRKMKDKEDQEEDDKGRRCGLWHIYCGGAKRITISKQYQCIG